MSKTTTFSGFKQQFSENPTLKKITIIVGVALVLIVGWIVYYQLVSVPNTVKSNDSYYEGLNLAEKDSTDAAIEQLQSQVKKYDGYQGGEVAQYVLGRQYMNKGEFKKALKELDDVDLEDTYNSVLCVGLRGDCHSELNQFKDALELYEEAANMDDNDFTTPMFLFKAAGVAEELKNFEKATELYEKIRDNYPVFGNQKHIDRYIARVSNVKAK
jgi:tetratricopeptide (TPR) repeat protein